MSKRDRSDGATMRALYWPSLVIALAVIVLLVFLGWRIGGLIDEQHNIVEGQRIAAEQAEARTAVATELMREAIEEVRKEIRVPAGPRAEHLDRLDEKLDRILEILNE